MKQLFMKKNPVGRANLIIEDVPAPKCGTGSILISNRYSLISAGTESASVKRNMKDMVVKAMTDPEIRDSVKDMLIKDGIRKTADRVHFETNKWTPMGYSGAGIAAEVGTEADGVGKGDLVAYGGEGHAEYIRASKNLCVSIPEGVDAREASFVAVGSIALQAVRRAHVQVGEIAAVLGLGLVGQLVSQILQASGARVLGSDIIPERLELAKSLGTEKGFIAGDKMPDEILRYTNGVGVDHVLICAATSNSEIIEQAVMMARDRARMTVVGMVNLEVPCEEFYRKEMDMVISRSYGPGRYDSQYEEHGTDYPIGYVRWTENRNMEEFLRLLQAKKVNVSRLISHEFDLAEAAKAYETLIEHPDNCLAIVLRYDESYEPIQRKFAAAAVSHFVKEKQTGVQAGVAVVGCGAFARQFHLPNIKSSQELNLKMLTASSGQSAKEMAARYGAEKCSTDFREALEDQDIDAVMIFTRDNSHADIAVAALKAGKHVFCEKPLATSYEQCKQIAEVYRNDGPVCMVGFNRRFAPLIHNVKEITDSCNGPKIIHYRVNAGPLPKDNWVYDPAYAAGRIIGEGCHFIDLMTWLTQSEPVSVYAQASGENPSLARLENVTATFQFSDGSVGTLVYASLGSSAFPKERMEIFADGTTLAMDDYLELSVRGKKRLNIRNKRSNKGHNEEMAHFTRVILGKEKPELNFIDGIRGTICSLKLWESVNTGNRQTISLDEIIQV